MDIVKAVISIGEASIQLEGPQAFVEKYLELYRPDASKWQTALSQKGEVKTKEEAPSRRIRAVKPKAGPSCADRIHTLINEDYFKDTKTSTEVMNFLREQKGIPYETKHVTAALLYIIKSGKLRRFKEGGVYRYCNV